MANNVTDTSGYDWAIFNDEGMLAGQMSYAAARAEADAADAEDGVVVDRECSEHEEQRATACEECLADGEEDIEEG